jgi:uncharacterized iron-regulated protein
MFRTCDDNRCHRSAILKQTSWYAIFQLKMMIESWKTKNLARTESLSKIDPY